MSADLTEQAEGGGADVLLRWPNGGHRVSVTGTFNNWGPPIDLVAEPDAFGRGSLFSGTLRLPFGRHQFHYIVDGKPTHDPMLKSVTNEEGAVFNVLEVVREDKSLLQVPEKVAGKLVDPRRASAPHFMRLQHSSSDKNFERYSAAAPTLPGSPVAVINAAEQRAKRNFEQEYDLRPRHSSTAAVSRPQGVVRSRSAGSAEEITQHSRFSPTSNAPTASAAYRKTQETTAAAVGSYLATSSVKREGKLLVAMAGLPGQGKSFLSHAIKRHLDWIGLRSRIFNVMEYRRKHVSVWEPAEFFDPEGEGEAIRERMAALAMEDMIQALKQDIDIAIFDSTNTTRKRRQWMAETMAQQGLHAQIVFIETMNNDMSIVRANVKETKLTSPEYQSMSEEEAMEDFMQRITQYKKKYQPLDADEGFQFIKVIDAGRQLMTNMISGYIPGRIMLLVANLHLAPRPIWMSRHGESEFNMQGRIGGDAPLTAAGEVYAGKLAEFMREQYPHGSDLTVWTSTMLRTGQTVFEMQKFWEVIKWRALDEINAGLMDGLTYEYVAANMPDEYEARARDKLRYRYPRGESYEDVFARLEPVLFEMLRQRTPLLIVGHQAILRVLYGYLMRKTPDECPALNMPLHTVIKCTPRAYGCDEEWRYPLEECKVPVKDTKYPTSY